MQYTTKPNLPVTPTALATILLATTTAAFAANTSQIKVTGTITPAACNVNIDSNGVFDYGDISADNLSQTQANKLGERSHILHIDCPGSAQIGVRTLDNVATSKDTSDGVGAILDDAGGQWLFGLGTASDGTKLGAYKIVLLKNGLKINGTTNFQYAESNNLGQNWDIRGGDIRFSDQNIYQNVVRSWVEEGQSAPSFVNTVEVPLQVTAAVKPLGRFPGSEILKLNGDVTLQLYYL